MSKQPKDDDSVDILEYRVATLECRTDAPEGRPDALHRMIAEPLDLEELTAWLRLASAPNIGPTRIRRLLERFGLPGNVLRAKPSALTPYVGAVGAEYLLAPPTVACQRELERVVAWIEDPSHHFVVLGDPAYPPALLESPDPPPVLYICGRLELLHPGPLGQPTVAVVGSRHATHMGKMHARRFARALGEAGVPVVSGLALGVDAVAHESAIDTVGGTIAVVGTGADRHYPRSNVELAERIAIDGAIVSEWPLGTPPRPAHFPRRNRVIAALSTGVLVVEATPHSGSLITAQLAVDYGRDVYAIPGSVEAPYKRGCNRLIRDGAMLVETPVDLLAVLGLACPEAQREQTVRRGTLQAAGVAGVADVPHAATPAMSTEAPTAATSETPTETPAAAALGMPTAYARRAVSSASETRRVLAALGHDPTAIDVLIARTGLSGPQVQSAVLSLELDGEVEWLTSGLVARIVS